MDHAGNVWVNGQGLSKYTVSGSTVTSPAPFTGGGLTSGPIAIDGNGSVWVADNNSLSEFANNGAALSPATGYGAFINANAASVDGVPVVYNPLAIGIDRSGDVWTISPARPGETIYYQVYGYVVTDTIGVAAPVVTVLSPGALP